MRRPFLFIVLLLVSLAFGAVVTAVPQAQEARPVIAQPAQDAPVRGVVQIVGTAVHPQFQRYELYYAPWPVPSDQSWIFIGDAHFNQQPLGLLGTWDSRSVTDGTYALRVRVVKADGNYLDSDPRRVLVANTRPVETPTPFPTDTPEPLPTQPLVIPTTVLTAPTAESSPTPEPTPTAEPEVTPILAVPRTPEGQAGAASITDQLFSGARLLDIAEQAATYTVAAFLAIGLFFGVKWVLAWLWHKIRP